MYDEAGGWEILDTVKLATTISKLKSLGTKNIVLKWPFTSVYSQSS